MRTIDVVYRDPLDLIWLATANELGIEVQRSSEVFATWDGAGILTLGTTETLDADDSLAQLIFHELCHAMVEGPDGFEKPDWGLGNQRARNEYACLRLQAKLADRFGLRDFLAATTDFRSYYDALPADPLEGQDDAVPLAIAGWQRSQQPPWSAPLERALQLTSQLAQCVAPLAPADSLWRRIE